MQSISFALTPDQLVARTKFVTRRFGWWKLKPGDQLRAVYRCMGLKKGERQQPILDTNGKPIIIEVTNTRAEPLNAITGPDVVKEGFPWLNRGAFIDMLCKAHRCKPDDICNRIEFIYVENN